MFITLTCGNGFMGTNPLSKLIQLYSNTCSWLYVKYTSVKLKQNKTVFAPQKLTI